MAVFLSGAQNLMGGASHDDLDGGKMGDKRIRMGGKAGALGRGVKREKEGRFAMVGRHGAAGDSSGRRSRQLGRQLHRRGGAEQWNKKNCTSCRKSSFAIFSMLCGNLNGTIGVSSYLIPYIVSVVV